VPHAKAINQRLRGALDTFYDIEEKLMANGKPVSLDAVLEMYQKGADMDFISFIDAELKANRGGKYSYQTLRNNISKCNQLRAFRPQIRMADVCPDLFLEFADYLSATNGKNGINAKFKFFRAMCNEAIRQGYMGENPFDHIPIRDLEHEPKEVLTKAELDKLYDLWENGDLPGYLHNTLTFFIGGCHTGGDYATYFNASFLIRN